MGKCNKCGSIIPRQENFNGKRILLVGRKYCTACSPIGERKIWKGKETCLERLKVKRNIKDPIPHTCKFCGRFFSVKSRNTECTTCSNLRIRNYRKIKAITLLGGKCNICGYNKCKRAMVFHHKNIDDKEMNISANWGISWNRIEKELNKCVLLCNRCHEEVHDGIITI